MKRKLRGPLFIISWITGSIVLAIVLGKADKSKDEVVLPRNTCIEICVKSKTDNKPLVGLTAAIQDCELAFPKESCKLVTP